MALASPRPASAYKIPAAFGGSMYAPSPLTTQSSPPPATPPPSAPAPVDYQALLASDPILGQTLSGYNAQGVGNQAQLTAAQQRALIQYGRVPSMTLPGAPNIDATTRALADQNTGAGTSTVANLRRAYELAQQGADANLAARGMLRSGAYGQHAAENLQGYNQAGYQADQTLLDYLQGLYSGFLSQQQTLQGSGVQATNDALNRIIAQINAGQLAGGAAAPVSAPAQVAAAIGPVPGAADYAAGRQPDPFAGFDFAVAARQLKARPTGRF